MNRIVSKLVGLIVVLAAIVMVLSVFSGLARADSATITTDKRDYYPEETVIINGSGFTAGSLVNVTVVRPGPLPDYVRPSPTAQADGTFTCNYQLDGIQGNYTVIATDGVHTATTWFMDGLTYSINGWDAGTSPGWTGGNLFGYNEGDSVPYKVVVYNGGKDAVPMPAWMNIRYQFYDSGYNSISIDYLYGFIWRWGDFTTVTPPADGNNGFTPDALTTPVTQPDTAAAPSAERYFTITPGHSGIPTSVPAGQTLVFYYYAHLSRSLVWLHCLESQFPMITSQISWASTCTVPHLGSASFSQGSNLHMYLDIPGAPGAKKVPIPVPPAPPPGSISGHKWNDVNMNGVYDAGDLPIEGWDITLSGSIDGIPINPTIQTLADGSYLFQYLDLGTWTVSEQNILPGWTPSSPTTQTVTLTLAAPDATNVDFLNWYFQPVTVKVYKYTDITGDGKTADDTPLAGWTVYLWTDGVKGAAQTTGADGSYTWSNLGPGSYMVSEDVPSDWTATSDTSHDFGTATSGGSYSFTFTNFKNVDISVTKVDTNDAPVSGWTVYLWTDGVKGAAQMTGADGSYTWSNLGPGDYMVSEDVPSDWTAIGPTEYDFGIVSSGHATYAFEFVNFKNVDISVTKVDTNDAPVSGWTVQLWKDGVLYDTQMTGADGSYTWTNLAGPADYKVIEIVPSDWTAIGPTEYDFGIVSSGHATYAFEFVNFKNVDITVIKYNDLMGDGLTQDDLPMAGWTVSLYRNGLLIDTELTGANGVYTWTNLGPGSYCVMEDVGADWYATSPTANCFGTVVSGQSYSFTFTNFKKVTITADKWNDLNGNGIKDSNEPEILGWQLTLTGPAGGILIGTPTQGSPASWIVVKGGTYTVSEELQDGWTHTTSSTMDVTVQSGSAPATLWFGNFENIDLTVYKFVDKTGDGISADDVPYEGWTIYLYKNDVLLPNGVQQTGSDGSYTWLQLGPGVYTVYEDQTMQGWIQTVPIGSLGVPYYSVNAVSGQDVTGVKSLVFENFQAPQITVKKLNDLTGDGETPDDVPMAGWPVHLWKDGVMISSEVTGADGTYTWGDLAPGSYVVDETVGAEWYATSPTMKNFGTVESGVSYSFTFTNFKKVTITADKWNDLNGDGVKDSNEPEIPGWQLTLTGPAGGILSGDATQGSPATWIVIKGGDYAIEEGGQPGWISTTPALVFVNVQSGSTPITVWFGNFNTVSITAVKYNDLTGDGLTADDTPLAGWTVHLWKNAAMIDTQSTGADGSYTWGGLGPGQYAVSEDVPSDWYATSPTTHDFGTAISGETYSFTFTNFKKVTITADKFNDLNGNGVKDAGEPEIAGWQLTLTGPAGGILSGDATQGSPASWVLIKAGTYTVSEELQGGWTHTTAASVDVSVQSGSTPATVWFGNFKLVSVTAVKYTDLTGDGLTADDTPLAGWTVHLWKDQAMVDTQVTGADGKYTWTGLGPGQYAVSEDVPGDWYATSPATHDFGTVISGESYSFTFTNFEKVTVTAVKYSDLMGDGLTADDTPLEGWTVYLYKNGLLADSELTGADGSYSWTGLGPGSYCVMEDVGADWYATSATSHCFGTVVSGQSYSFTFTNFKKVTITADKFNDLNGNGVKDAGEPEIAGWQLTLTGPAGGVLSGTATQGSPATWVIVKGGTYTVTEEQQAGWIPTTPTSDSRTVESGSTPATIWFGNWHMSSFVTETNNQRTQITTFTIVFSPCTGSTGEYKISSTNPGSFYYNVLLLTGGYDTVTYSLGNAFSTQGSMPVHAYLYDSSKPLYVNGAINWAALTDVTNEISTDESPGLHGGTIDVSQVPSGEFLLLTIHMNFELKGSCGDMAWVMSFKGEVFTFSSNDGSASSATLTAMTKASKVSDPTILGVVKDPTLGDSPVAGVTVRLFDSENKLVGTTVTDSDGNYLFSFAASGKYKVVLTLPSGYTTTESLSRTVNCPAGSVTEMNFNIWKSAGSTSVFGDLGAGLSAAQMAGIAILVISGIVGLLIGPISAKIDERRGKDYLQ